ncbi:hypothetical protein V2G26_001885 [Clonostachys chloroleuca]
MASLLKSILLLIQLSGQTLALPYHDEPPVLTTTSLNGNTRCASINLSNCIANRGGTLRWARDGNFHNTCWNCTFYGIDPGSLTCQCLKDKKDTSDYTSIALPKFMRNENGRLACEGYKSEDNHCPGTN